MIIYNLVRICDATSLHTSTQNGETGNQPQNLALFGVLQGLWASPTQRNSSSVPRRTQGGHLQPCSHWGCN